MPTYYNGKEITATSIMSGLSLSGRTSIRIGGLEVTLSTRPELKPTRLISHGRITDPMTVCMFAGGGGPPGTELNLFSASLEEGNTLFEDSDGTMTFDGGDAYLFDPMSNSVYQVGRDGTIGRPVGCSR